MTLYRYSACVQFRSVMQSYTSALCSVTQRYAELHSVMQSYTALCRVTQRYAELHSVMQRYTTELHSVMPKSSSIEAQLRANIFALIIKNCLFKGIFVDAKVVNYASL